MRHVPHFSQRPRRRFLALRLLLLVCVIGAAGWFIGLTWYAKQMPDLVVDDTTRTDAIVVLTGGSDRLETGQRLLDRGLADKLFISGVYHGVEVHQLLEVSKTRPETLECCVELGFSAQSTLGNAQETAAWAAKKGISSIRLVTSNYHMPRSLLEFKSFMPHVTVIPHPVFPQSVRTNDWWRWPGTSNLLAGEFNKYLVAMVRHQLMRSTARSAQETDNQ